MKALLYIRIETTDLGTVKQVADEPVVKQDKNIDDKEPKRDYTAVIKNLLNNLDNQSSIADYSEKLLSNIAKEFNIVQGIVFVKYEDFFKVTATYAYYSDEEIREFRLGEGISTGEDVSPTMKSR